MFCLQIEVFRTIHDEEGHSLTHNFRPTQPLGDRSIYFVTSFKGDNDLSEHDQKSHFNEPSQNIDSNDEHKIDRSTTVTTSTNQADNTDDIASNDDPNAVPNDISVETTTARHRKFPKPGRNNSLIYSISTQLLVFGISVIFIFMKINS